MIDEALTEKIGHKYWDYFVKGCKAADMKAPFEELLAAEASWELSGFGVHQSREAILTHCEEWMRQLGENSLQVKMLNWAVRGDTFFTERVDQVVAPDGTVLGGDPIMGVLRVRDGAIVELRDFFDPRPWLNAQSASS
jgi:limonene-1,2-epoxide hydrolase